LWCSEGVPTLRFRTLVAAAVLGVFALSAGGEAGSPAVAGAAPSRVCAATLPNGREPPRRVREGMPPVPPVFHGNGKLWVKLWPLGVIVARPNVVNPDGSIGIKLPWWRAVVGTLTVTATRLDAPAPAVRGDVPGGYGASGFQASGIDFPTQGCWRVTGTVGSTSLSFVTLVVKAARNGY
jgi:hypothetical protein